MKSKFLGLSFLILLLGVLAVFLAIKFYKDRLNLNVASIKSSRHNKEIPSMLRALPFKEQETPRKKSLLARSLKDNQILLQDIVTSPKKSPRGGILTVSVVLEFSSRKEASKYWERRVQLEQIIVECIQELNYRDLRSSEGSILLKKELSKSFNRILGDKILRFWIVEYKFQRIKRL